MMKNQNKIKIISYNLRYHRAGVELEKLTKAYNADILCLQECRGDRLPDEIGNLILGDKTPNWRLNIAVYYRKDRFTLTDSTSHVLKKAFLEWLFMPEMERLLVTKIYDRWSQKEVCVGGFHATSHVATNYVRKRQISTAHQVLLEHSDGCPTVMVGDYNYLLFKRGLKIRIEKSGYQLTLSDRPTYYFNKYLGVRFDMATSMNACVEGVKALPKSKLSDHTPILVQLSV